MPSRKRNKAKARSKGPPRYSWQKHLAELEEKCNHGCPQTPFPKHVHDSMELFESKVQKRLHDGCTATPGPGMYVLRDLQENHPVWWDDRTRSTLAPIFVTMGTDHILHGGPKNHQVAKDLAAVLLLLESQSQGLNLLAQNRDLRDGDEKELIKFFKRRTPCKCLDEAYEKYRAQPKLGSCSHCKEKKERSTLLLCGNCKVEQYCSPECQRASWPKHKKDCEFLVVREACIKASA